MGEKVAPDSLDLLAAFLGESPRGRSSLVEHANVLALRKGEWKYVEGEPQRNRNKNGVADTGGAPQLYRLSTDLAETTNLVDQHPEKAQEMAEELARLRAIGRSR